MSGGEKVGRGFGKMRSRREHGMCVGQSIQYVSEGENSGVF